jgi:hypothetical protein
VADEAAATAGIAEIRATVLDTDDAKKEIRPFGKRRPAVFRGA